MATRVLLCNCPDVDFIPLRGHRQADGMSSVQGRRATAPAVPAGRLVAYAAGYTGLGVAASRFGANVMLDLLGGEPTERTALSMVRTKPVPFPPEPVRSAVIQLTRASLARADRNGGRRELRACHRLPLRPG